MHKSYLFAILLILSVSSLQPAFAQVLKNEAAVSKETYLINVQAELVKKWPKNRTINLVFHGHSVPSGYFQTPYVNTLQAYPLQVLAGLKKQYPYAVINSITTSIGGENSVQGEKRFKKDVLSHRPDVLFIDYALNDRNIGLQKSRQAMEKMIKMALKKNIKVILLTPSPDLGVNLLQENNVLEQYAHQLIQLAVKYQIGVVDSYGLFKAIVVQGKDLKSYMAQSNHPNQMGHALIAQGILMKYFNTK